MKKIVYESKVGGWTSRKKFKEVCERLRMFECIFSDENGEYERDHIMALAQRNYPRHPETRGEYLHCERCDNRINWSEYAPNFCDHCGQRIDWTSDEELEPFPYDLYDEVLVQHGNTGASTKEEAERKIPALNPIVVEFPKDKALYDGLKEAFKDMAFRQCGNTWVMCNGFCTVCQHKDCTSISHT